MKKALPVCLIPCVISPLFFTDLNLRIESSGQSAIKVSPGSLVGYSVIGELSDASNEGLALFSLDLSFSGGPLSPANAPSSGPMLQFAIPLGLNNPGGFGGTISGGNLLQLGGAQNTINNIFAPYPSGSVVTGIAKPGFPQSLVAGSLSAPYTVGTYTLSLSNPVANVVQQGATGVPFWKVDAAGAGTITNLSIEVEALRGDLPTVSISAGESQSLFLDAGPANAGRFYFLLGSFSGTSPGTPIGMNLVLPLNADRYFQFTRHHPNSAILQNSLGNLDNQGKATAIFTPVPRFEGFTLHHAFFLMGPVDFVSNPVPVQVTN